MRLVRLAAEYIPSLKFLLPDHSIPIAISHIQSTLSCDLDHLFSATATGKLSEDKKAKLMANLSECLRTYDALRLWYDAEDVLRCDVVRDFVRSVFLARLTTHTLSLPRTPSPTHVNASAPHRPDPNQLFTGRHA